MRRPVSLITLSLSIVVICRAQVTTVDVSPDFSFGDTRSFLDGRIPGMVLDPNNNSIVYAVGEWTGVWKSTDGAHTWRLSSAGLRNGITQESAYPNLAIDASNSQRLLYASTSKDGRGFSCEGCQFGGLWTSTNGATSWQHVNLCSTSGSADNISSVAFSTGHPFVATDCGFWTTSDSALQSGWSKLALPNGVSPGGTVIAPGGFGQTLIASLGGGTRVYRSLDLGKSWDAGVDLGGRCTGLSIVRQNGESQPSTSAVSFATGSPKTQKGPGSEAMDVAIVNHIGKTKQTLGFANVAQGGSGRSGVWTAPRTAAAGAGPGISYEVFAADNLNFYRYTGNNNWSNPLPLHVDTWWMEFSSSYNGANNCEAFAANDGGVWANASSSCGLNGWGAALSGLHVTWGNHISGLSPNPGDTNAQACAANHGGQPCPLLFLPTTDDDTFIRQASSYTWTNFPDGLGDAGEVWIDPLLSNLALACRNGNYNLFVASQGQVVSAGTKYFPTIAQGTPYATGITAPTVEGIKEILTMPGETVINNGDFLAIQSAFSTDLNKCVENHNCGNDVIVRNASAALGQPQAQSSWFDISPEAHFGPGQIAGIYPSGGHNTMVYVLTSNASGVNYSGSSYAPGHVYKAYSQIIGEAIGSWQPASGSGANSLVRAYNIFVNPYNANEVWAIDLGSNPSAIKVSRDGGGTWAAVPQLKDIATNYGEFDFTCGAFANGPGNYNDKEIFGNECSMTEMLFPVNQPQVRFAILYPGGIAFSGDGGNTWLPLNATNAGAGSQPIEMPQSAFYDPTVNGAGNSSLYVALEGKGIKRLDAAFATLGSGKQAPATYQPQSVGDVTVLGSDGNLWLEQAPFGKVPPHRQQVDSNAGAFQWVDSGHMVVLGHDGNLWLEEAPFGGKIPPQRQHVDANVAAFQELDLNHIFVLGKDGNLWLEQGPFGKVPPQRQQVDGNVGAFQATDVNHVAVLGTDGNLWLEQAPFGKVPQPGRVQVDGNVQRFHMVDGSHIVVVARNSNLWLEQGPFGKVPPSRQQVDANVRNFQVLNLNQIIVLGNNGNAWMEQGPFGRVPPPRQQIDASVASVWAVDGDHVFTLGTDGNLWLEQGPFGKVPPARQQVDAKVHTPTAGY